jgi:hypothetical protein
MAFKYKVQADGGNHVVITVDSGDLNTPLGISRYMPRGLEAVNNGGAVDLYDVVSDKKEFATIAYDNLIQSDNSAWGANITEVVTALNIFFKTSPHELEDLDDIPTPVEGRFLKYESGAYTWAVATAGSPPPAIDELNDLTDVNISNPQNDEILQYDGNDWVNVTFPGTSVDSIEDLGDVTLTSLSDDQILQYNSVSGDWENVDIPDETLGSSITISNTDAAFSHMTSPITAGTSVEKVLRDILEKYNITSISLSNVSAAYETTTSGVYGSYSNRTGATLEVGTGLRIQGFNYSVADSSKTTDSSVKFLRGGTTLESGFADNLTSATLASVEEVNPTSATSYSYKLQAIDSGGGSDVTLNSNSRTFSWRYRVKVGASSTSTLSSASDAQTLYDNITTTGAYDNLKTNSAFTAQCSSAMETAGNYTYIIYPASFTEITSIVQGGAIPVLGAFTDLGDFTIDNQYGVSISYSFYRSNITQAFADSTYLDITF